MATASLGKKFEKRFAQDWKESFPNTFLFRLMDQMSGYKLVSANPCDFLAFNNGTLWMLECKETKEGTFNFAKLTQYDLLKTFEGLEGVIPVVVIWFSKFDRIAVVRMSEIEKMKAAGLKSVSVKALGAGEWDVKDVPAKKLRTFLKADYSALPAFYGIAKPYLTERENDK